MRSPQQVLSKVLDRQAIILWLIWTTVPTVAYAQLNYSEFLPFTTSVKFVINASDEQLKEAAKFSSDYNYVAEEEMVTYELAIDNEHRVAGQVRFTDSLRFTDATWYFFDEVHVEGQFVDEYPVGEWRVYDLDNVVSKIVHFSEGSRNMLPLENYQVQWYVSEGDTLVDQGMGTYNTYWPQGSIYFTGSVRDGAKNGHWVAYTPDGELLYEEEYQHGQFMKGISFGADSISYTYDSLFTGIHPYGGWDAYYQGIEERLHYPKKARREGVAGVIYLRMVVERDGSLGELEVLQGIGMGCDEEAVRAVEQGPHWIPATIRGQPVRLRVVLPITFKLGDSGSKEYPAPPERRREVSLKPLPPPRQKP